MSDFKDKIVVITGGSGAIGSTTARKFLDKGAKVVLVDIDEASLKKTAGEINNNNLSYISADVTNATEVQKYVDYTVEKWGKIDIFFNNAGIEGKVSPTTDLSETEFDKVINVNVKGVFLGMKHIIPHMNDGGSIINTSSVAGVIGMENLIAYVASKHAVVGMTRTVAYELASRGIRVNTIHPAPVDNRMMRSIEEGFSPGKGDAVKTEFIGQIPMGRYANNDDIANGVLFLASDENSFMTGSKLVVDGGMTMP